MWFGFEMVITLRMPQPRLPELTAGHLSCVTKRRRGKKKHTKQISYKSCGWRGRGWKKQCSNNMGKKPCVSIKLPPLNTVFIVCYSVPPVWFRPHFCCLHRFILCLHAFYFHSISRKKNFLCHWEQFWEQQSLAGEGRTETPTFCSSASGVLLKSQNLQ